MPSAPSVPAPVHPFSPPPTTLSMAQDSLATKHVHFLKTLEGVHLYLRALEVMIPSVWNPLTPLFPTFYPQLKNSVVFINSAYIIFIGLTTHNFPV